MRFHSTHEDNALLTFKNKTSANLNKKTPLLLPSFLPFITKLGLDTNVGHFTRNFSSENFVNLLHKIDLCHDVSHISHIITRLHIQARQPAHPDPPHSVVSVKLFSNMCLGPHVPANIISTQGWYVIGAAATGQQNENNSIYIYCRVMEGSRCRGVLMVSITCIPEHGILIKI